jgi:hypothetical protein
MLDPDDAVERLEKSDQFRREAYAGRIPPGTYASDTGLHVGCEPTTYAEPEYFAGRDYIDLVVVP